MSEKQETIASELLDGIKRNARLAVIVGILFATLITLVLVPSLYLIREDIQDVVATR